MHEDYRYTLQGRAGTPEGRHGAMGLSSVRLDRLVFVIAGIYLFSLPLPYIVSVREGCLFLAVAITAVRGVKTGRWEWPPIKVLLLLWVGIALASLAASGNVSGSVSEIKKEIVYPILAFWLFYSITRDRRDFINMSFFILATSTLAILASLYSYYYLGLPSDGLKEVGYLYGLKAYFGFLMLSTGALCIAISMSPGVSRAVKVYAVALIPFCLLGVYFARLRSGYLSIVVSTCVFLAYTNIFKKNNKRKALILAFILLMVAAIPSLMSRRELTLSVNPNNISHYLSTLSREHRIIIWKESVEGIRLRPALGLGFGNKEVTVHIEGEDLRIYPHNLFLSYGVMTGVPGLLLLLLIFAWLFTIFHRRTMRSLSAGGPALGVNLSGVLFVLTFFILNLTADVMTRHTGQLFWAITGMMLGSSRAGGQETNE